MSTLPFATYWVAARLESRPETDAIAPSCEEIVFDLPDVLIYEEDYADDDGSAYAVVFRMRVPRGSDPARQAVRWLVFSALRTGHPIDVTEVQCLPQAEALYVARQWPCEACGTEHDLQHCAACPRCLESAAADLL